MQTPGTYLHHTVSMVRLPNLDLLIFHSTCTGTLVPGSFQKKDNFICIDILFQNVLNIQKKVLLAHLIKATVLVLVVVVVLEI